MAVWQTKEDLLVQLTSLVDDEKSEAAFQLKSFQDPQGDIDVVRMLLHVVAKQNKTGNSCWRITNQGELQDPDNAESPCFYAFDSLKEIGNIDELLEIVRGKTTSKNGNMGVASDQILVQALWLLGDMRDQIGTRSDVLRADITSLITSGLYDDAVVFAAISTLERLGMLSEAELLSTLNNAHPSIRWIMLKALCKVNPEPRSIGLLGSLMLDPSQSSALRSMIIHNIIYVDDPRLNEPLISLLKDDSPSVRQHAALSLGEKEVLEAQTPLFQLLIDEDEMVRLSAGVALGALGDTRTIPFLLKSIREGDMRIQRVAKQALAKLGTAATPDLVQALRVEPMPYKQDAIKILQGLQDPRSILALIESLLDDELFSYARTTILEMMEQAEKPLLFVAKNNDVDADFREKCLRILIETNSEHCFEALESMLSASETRLQLLSIQLLGDLKHKKCGPLLLKQLNKPLGGSAKIKERLRTQKQQASDPDPRFLSEELQKEESLQNHFLAETLLALGKQKSKKSIPYLLQGLEQKDSRIYSFSISGLGYIKAIEALEPLCAIVSDRSGRYKEQAIQTLAKIGDEKAIPFLRNIVKEVQKEREYRPDAPSSLASYAIQALALLGDVEVINMILTSWEDELEGAILSLGDTAIPLLSDALSYSQSNKIRLLSAEALGLLGAKEAMGTLIGALQDKDEDVRTMSAWALNEVYRAQEVGT